MKKNIIIIIISLFVGLLFLMIFLNKTDQLKEEEIVDLIDKKEVGDLIEATSMDAFFSEETETDTEKVIIKNDETLQSPSLPLEKETIDLKSTMDSFINCLVEKGMVVYASKTCPACVSFADLFGGYDKVDSLFVICNQEPERCGLEMKDRFVPEIQIKGELYNGPRDLNSLAEETGCSL